MKYYSEKTKNLYNSEKELQKAEEELAKLEEKEKTKKEMRATRAKEVEEAYRKYQELLDAFIKDYGYYHTTITDSDSLFNILFNRWPF